MILPALVLAATCCVTGNVTFVAHDRERSGILEPDDGTPAFWFAGENNSEIVSSLVGAESLSPGDRVLIRGERSALGFAPGMVAREIVYLGRGGLRPAPEMRLRDLDWGVMDNACVALCGVLTAVKETDDAYVRLTLATKDGSFAAEAPKSAADWSRLVDATLRLEGSAMSRFNIRSEFIGVMLQVVSADGVEVLSAPDDPFARPLTPLDGVLSYSLAGPDLHRRHVKGVVTYVRPGEFLWLADGTATLKVRTVDTEARVGDEVEAVGFATRQYGLGSLDSASLRVVGHPGVPEAVHVGWVELGSYPVDTAGKFRNFDGRRVSLEGRVLSALEDASGHALVVESEKGHLVNVRIDGRDAGLSPSEISWGPTLRITGVLELEQEKGIPEGQMPAIQGWTLRVGDPSDVVILHNADWAAHAADIGWHRTVLVFAALAALALVGFVVYLIRLRGERRRLGILTAERKRMAADLHDTLEQHLAGARMVLNSAVAFTPDVPANVKAAVANANELLAHAKSEMRARIFDMRSDVLFTQGPEKVIRGIADKIGSSGVVKVRTRLRGLPEHLTEQVFSEMVFITQEALTNAIKHGKAKNIVIAADPQESGFALTVANDGEPFDPSKALGPEAGHYGLSGMRERAKRAGIGLAFEHAGRWMTVRMTVSR